ncbi:MAG: hypothetical protein IPM21_03655 [Acidobacteria bacterium]|nr:hypothetical protein [Acidobacteriota bacterium]
MISAIDPKVTEKPLARCTECDREVTHYNTFLSPTNDRTVVCWECLSREEKGFFAHRGYTRGARTGVIPR